MAHFTTIVEWDEYLQRVYETRVTFGEQFMQDDSEIAGYVKYLRFKEKTRIIYGAKGPQRNIRGFLIKFILKVAEKEGFTWATVYSAVHIYDRFMDNHSVARKQVHLVALASLIIAGKVEERDTKTPKVCKLAQFLPKDSDFNVRLYNDIEIYVIGYFQWNMIIPTPYTFLECFLLYALDGITSGIQFPVDENLNQSASLPAITIQDIGYKIRHYSLVVLEDILKAEPRDRFSPSCIAASVLQYARRKYGLNFWTARLTTITGCSHTDIVNCLIDYIDAVVPYDYNNGPLLNPYFVDSGPCYCSTPISGSHVQV